ncbi:hypothetical protein CU048_04385 [Beijerinckiaceae bacterium]|nr:hypothetical protein CU048_04385 [Beijerinckiaceae bacterium]
MIDIVIDNAMEGIQSGLLNLPKPFLSSAQGMACNQSWNAYAYFYAKEFEEIAENALKLRRVQHAGPLLFLARQSIELAMKNAINEFEPKIGSDAGKYGHDLKKLWRTLIDLMRFASFSADCEWTQHCEQVVDHIDAFDNKGERFRYPADRAGDYFEYPDVDIDGLVKAHWNLTAYCDAVIECLHAQRII